VAYSIRQIFFVNADLRRVTPVTEEICWKTVDRTRFLRNGRPEPVSGAYPRRGGSPAAPRKERKFRCLRSERFIAEDDTLVCPCPRRAWRRRLHPSPPAPCRTAPPPGLARLRKVTDVFSGVRAETPCEPITRLNTGRAVEARVRRPACEVTCFPKWNRDKL